MAKMKRSESGMSVAVDAKGTYVRTLGTKEGGAPVRFYLGTDRAQAVIRSLQLESAWDAVVRRWQRDHATGKPEWDGVTLTIAKAVARGESTCQVQPPSTNWQRDKPGQVIDLDTASAVALAPEAAVAWLRRLQDDFPTIRLTLEDASAQEQGEAFHTQQGRRLLEEGNRLLKKNTKQTLHQALDAYSSHLREANTKNGVLSTTGQTALKDVQRIKEHVVDMPLGSFDLAAIDAMLLHWSKRPLVKTVARMGMPAKKNTVKNTIKKIRAFIRWLHKAEFDWRKPADYEVEPFRSSSSQEELAEMLLGLQVELYLPAELTTLYQYAKPRERVWMLLALNCGFGIAEISSLLKSDIHLNKPHRYYRDQPASNRIERLRGKTEVYGEWRLWDATVEGLQWYLTTARAESTSKRVFVGSSGSPLAEQTSGGNRAQEIPNDWAALTKRIQKDLPEFRKLSFNKLRKTAISGISDLATGEIASIFGAHGQPFKGDNLLELYRNRPFDRVHLAVDQWGARLAGMMASVAEPFTTVGYKHSPKHEAERQRVRALRAQGYKLAKIVEETGFSWWVVRGYLKDWKPE